MVDPDDKTGSVSVRARVIRWVSRPPVVVAGFVLLIGGVLAFAGGGAVPALCAVVIAAFALVESRPGYVPYYSYGLPGVPDGPLQVRAAGGPAPLVTALAGGLGVAVVGSLGFSPWLAVAILIAVILVVGRRIAPWLLGRRHAWRIRRALNDYAPRVAMGYAGRSGGPWQLRMWEPFILRSGERNVVINKHEKYVDMILESANLSSPLIQVGSRGLEELDELLIPSIRAMFYVQNARTNAAFLAHTDITHVWLNHGDSDKPANYNTRHGDYDLLVVCGQAGVERYERHGIDIPREKFRILGRPQSSGIVIPDRAIGDQDTKMVLYAPTWQGLDESVNFSSLEQGPAIVRGLLERGAIVLFRPHPLSYRWRRRRAVIKEIRGILMADREASGRMHHWGSKVDKKWTIAHLTNVSDALVSDVSSVVSDFLASGKPYAMTSMHGSVDEFREQNPVAEAAYVILGDMSNLDDVLDDMLFVDPLADQRQELRRHVLGDFTGEESAEAFASFVRTLAEGR